MKKFLAILLFFATVLPAVGQTDSVKIGKSTFRNKINLDIEFLGSGFNYERVISNRWALNSGIGVGVVLIVNLKELHNNDYREPDGNPQFFNTHFSLNYAFSRKIKVLFGAKYAVMMFGDVQFGHFVGAELGVFYLLKSIEIGVKGTVGSFENNIFIGTSLITIKIPISKW